MAARGGMGIHYVLSVIDNYTVKGEVQNFNNFNSRICFWSN